jgi:cobalt-zinc-cadmium efflux system membrane fusion protein
MPGQALHDLILYLRRATAPGDAPAVADAELLERFLNRRDQAAFELLVWRYGPLVLGVARRVLRDAGDVEDTFQATFLILARGARAISRRASVGGWLHKVAYRAALAARARAARRAARERPLEDPVVARGGPDPLGEAVWGELRAVLDDQLVRLPEKYRTAFVLRCLAGKSSAETARELGCSVRTVESRLGRARKRLRTALARRGFAAHAGLVAAGLAPALWYGTARAASATLVSQTARAAFRFVADPTAGGPASAPAAGLAQGVLRAMFIGKVKAVAVLVVALAVTVTGAGLLAQSAGDARPGAGVPELVPGRSDALRLPPAWLTRAGIRAAQVKARRAATTRALHLDGVLTLDQAAHVSSRFAGEVTAIREEGGRPLRVGDAVKAGQLLAVVWSKELGAKKAALFDAVIELHRDEQRLQKLKKLFEEGGIAEAVYRQAQRAVQKGRNAVTSAERTLRIWKLNDAEVEAVRREAAKAGDRGRDAGKEAKWARVEIRAPRPGKVVEKNVAVGDIININTTLFIIADLSRLGVVAHVPEADLAALQALPQADRRWTVRPRAGPEGPAAGGWIEGIATAVDPKTRTAVVHGWVQNSDRRLLAGQLVTATVPLARQAAGEVAVPASALVEDGKQVGVFVQPDPKEFRYELRRVLLVRRGRDVAHVRSRPGPKEARRGFGPLRPGEWVVTQGAVELQALLDDLRGQQPPPGPGPGNGGG